MIPKYKQIKKSSWQDIFFMAFFGLLILTVVGFLAFSNFRISQRRAMLNSQIEQLKAEIRAAEEKKQQLQVQAYESSQEEFLEREAREKLNLKKPGEEVVAVLPSEEDKTEEPQKQSFWDKILGKIKF